MHKNLKTFDAFVEKEGLSKAWNLYVPEMTAVHFCHCSKGTVKVTLYRKAHWMAACTVRVEGVGITTLGVTGYGAMLLRQRKKERYLTGIDLEGDHLFKWHFSDGPISLKDHLEKWLTEDNVSRILVEVLTLVTYCGHHRRR